MMAMLAVSASLLSMTAFTGQVWSRNANPESFQPRTTLSEHSRCIPNRLMIVLSDLLRLLGFALE